MTRLHEYQTCVYFGREKIKNAARSKMKFGRKICVINSFNYFIKYDSEVRNVCLKKWID